ncbi:MAG: hypothetical protein U0U66_12175 [Cytophagaceae bacterium]
MKNILIYLFLSISVTTTYCQVLDPNKIAKEYFNDIISKDENTFVSKYMLSQADFIYLMNQHVKNNDLELDMSDSLSIRSSVYKDVLQSYRDFKSVIEASSVPINTYEYLTCFYELEYENKDFRLLMFDELAIHFKSDTNYYAMHIDDLVFVNNHWVGGEFRKIVKTDSNYREIYYDGIYGDEYVAFDTAAVATYDYDYVDTAVDTIPTKKQQKIQKKIDAYYRKIDLLYQKQ